MASSEETVAVAISVAGQGVGVRPFGLSINVSRIFMAFSLID